MTGNADLGAAHALHGELANIGLVALGCVFSHAILNI